MDQGRCVALDEAMRVAREGRLLFAACYGVPAERFRYAAAVARLEPETDPGKR